MHKLMLEQLIPQPDAVETHCRNVDGSPERAYLELRAVTLAEMPLARTLFAVRGLSWRRGGLVAEPRRPMLQQMIQGGFAELVDEPGHEFTIGGVSQPWRLWRARTLPIDGADSFIAATTPGFVKMAMGFRFEPHRGGTRITTQTRVSANDAQSLRAFRPYWLLVRIGSGLIRRAMLRAVARRVQAN